MKKIYLVGRFTRQYEEGSEPEGAILVEKAAQKSVEPENKAKKPVNKAKKAATK